MAIPPAKPNMYAGSPTNVTTKGPGTANSTQGLQALFNKGPAASGVASVMGTPAGQYSANQNPLATAAMFSPAAMSQMMTPGLFPTNMGAVESLLPSSVTNPPPTPPTPPGSTAPTPDFSGIAKYDKPSAKLLANLLAKDPTALTDGSKIGGTTMAKWLSKHPNIAKAYGQG